MNYLEAFVHDLKLRASNEQIADLQDGLDAVLVVLNEINLLDAFDENTRTDLETLAAALHTITDEPTVQFEGAAYQIVVPAMPDVALVSGDDTQNVFTSPDDDDLSWLDPFRPDAP